MELRSRRWRRELWDRVSGRRILELGIGTGKNIPFHPTGAEVTGIDISVRMLAVARARAARADASVRLQIADAQALPYADASFDTVIGTYVFCSIPDPGVALLEAKRVLCPGGQLLLLEHVVSRRPLIGRLMRWLDPIPFRIWGAHIDRDTVADFEAAGFVEIETQPRFLDVVVDISARAEPG